MRRLLPEREPLYREVADAVVDTDRSHARADGRAAAIVEAAAERAPRASRCRSATAPTTSSSATARVAELPRPAAGHRPGGRPS